MQLTSLKILQGMGSQKPIKQQDFSVVGEYAQGTQYEQRGVKCFMHFILKFQIHATKLGKMGVCYIHRLKGRSSPQFVFAQTYLILEPVMSSSKCMRWRSPPWFSFRFTVTGPRKGFLASNGLEGNQGNVWWLSIPHTILWSSNGQDHS